VVFSFTTPAQEMTVQTRNAVFKTYMDAYAESVAEIDAHYDELLRQEQVWEQRWATMVSSLVNSSKDIA
jgi:hypothetical protein